MIGGDDGDDGVVHWEGGDGDGDRGRGSVGHHHQKRGTKWLLSFWKREGNGVGRDRGGGRGGRERGKRGSLSLSKGVDWALNDRWAPSPLTCAERRERDGEREAGRAGEIME